MTTEEILDRLEITDDLWNKSAIAHQVVYLLREGKDPLKLIGLLLSMYEDANNRLVDTVKNGTKHTIVIETKGEAEYLIKQMKWSDK